MPAVRKTMSATEWRAPSKELSRALLAALAQDRQDLGRRRRDVRARSVDRSDARVLQEVVVLGGNDPADHDQHIRPALLGEFLDQLRHQRLVAGRLARY